MPPKIYVPCLNIGSVPCAKALKKASKTFGHFKNILYLCTIKLLLNVKSTLLWTNYKTSKISSMSFADNE